MRSVSQEIVIETSDGILLSGSYSAGPLGGPAALLLHMMPATKESWAEFAAVLAARGFSTLAIDLRGHGRSTRGADGRKLDYKLFEDTDHQAKIIDVEAAAAWLERERGIGKSRLVVVGASIGANLAIAFAAAHPEIPAAAALSPGLDYRGVTTPDQVRRFGLAQGLFLAASVEDELSFKTDCELARLKPDAVIREYQGAGHGTAMFSSRPELAGELAAWLANRAAPKP
ncbi:MAG: alpha/beta fold hydrolase [Patescibacteria group bacterium]|jgi:alpha-beta hydrolase superfamily lysophospholipase